MAQIINGFKRFHHFRNLYLAFDAIRMDEKILFRAEHNQISLFAWNDTKCFDLSVMRFFTNFG